MANMFNIISTIIIALLSSIVAILALKPSKPRRVTIVADNPMGPTELHFSEISGLLSQYECRLKTIRSLMYSGDHVIVPKPDHMANAVKSLQKCIGSLDVIITYLTAQSELPQSPEVSNEETSPNASTSSG